MLVITTLRNIDLHPVNYFFLAASFFAFHLLFAYLVDRLPLAPAFIICSLASRAIRGYGWGDRSDAPSTPLGSFVSTTSYNFERDQFPTEDVQRLLVGLSSDDGCVREMSVRLIGTQKPEGVASELITRLASPDQSLRSIAALGLGLVEAPTAIDPLIRTLRDAGADVRANSAWALGRIDDNGRALKPLVALFGDNAEAVREAAVVAVGHMDSVSTVAAPAKVFARKKTQVTLTRRKVRSASPISVNRPGAKPLNRPLSQRSADR